MLYVETHPVVNHKMIKQGNIALPVSNPRDPIVVGFEPVTDAPPQALTTTKQPLKKKPGVTLLQVLQMQRNNISHDIINSLIADSKSYRFVCCRESLCAFLQYSYIKKKKM